jgi:hypothetical protein
MNPSQFLASVKAELPEMPEKETRVIAFYPDARARFLILASLKAFCNQAATTQAELNAIIELRNTMALQMMEIVRQRIAEKEN